MRQAPQVGLAVAATHSLEMNGWLDALLVLGAFETKPSPIALAKVFQLPCALLLQVLWAVQPGHWCCLFLVGHWHRLWFVLLFSLPSRQLALVGKWLKPLSRQLVGLVGLWPMHLARQRLLGSHPAQCLLHCSFFSSFSASLPGKGLP